MKLAVLLLCHKNAEQINLFLDTLKHPDIEFFIHMDKKANIVDQIEQRPDIHILPDCLRVDVRWGEFSQTQATLNLFWRPARWENLITIGYAAVRIFLLLVLTKLLTISKNMPGKIL